jgi:uncharacterized protein (TIGR02391 family)
MAFLNVLGDGEKKTLQRSSHLLGRAVFDYPADKHNDLYRALMESWMWLEREGMLAPSPFSAQGFYFITRRGAKMARPVDLDEYRKASRLPPDPLHPRLVQKIWGSFIRGDYESAIFQAFKEVEIAVREGAVLGPSEIGVALMRRAFDPRSGALREPSAPHGEREALSHLFAGAIGYCKNPTSHRPTGRVCRHRLRRRIATPREPPAPYR